MNVIRALLVAAVILTATTGAAVAGECKGKFLNPITDICWTCTFPMKVAGNSFMSKGQDDFDTDAKKVCTCVSGGNVTVGLGLEFWEPVRIFEALGQGRSGCFPMLSGLQVDFGVRSPDHGRRSQSGDKPQSVNTSFYEVHWYIAPWVFALQAVLDTRCLEQSPFDMAYVTELDPLWRDSESTYILNPDASLFTSIAATAACAADCVAATAGFSLPTSYFCAGCQGKMFPLTGWVGAHVSHIQASALLMQRFTNKLHREGLMWGAYGAEGQCGYYIQPIMDKRAYKYQMVWPSRATDKVDGKCCSPYGRTTMHWQANKVQPTREDMAYQIFRKRSCCQGTTLN
jgi:conjugal transfer pilus assembly protein TraU